MLEQYQDFTSQRQIQSVICLEVGGEDKQQEFTETYSLRAYKKKFPQTQEEAKFRSWGYTREISEDKNVNLLMGHINDMYQMPTFFLIPVVLGKWNMEYLSLCDSQGYYLFWAYLSN